MNDPVYEILGFAMRVDWLELHHGYYGIIMALIAWKGLSSQNNWIRGGSIILMACGLYLLDDTYQHHRQVWEPSYTSPVHNAFRFLY